MRVSIYRYVHTINAHDNKGLYCDFPICVKIITVALIPTFGDVIIMLATTGGLFEVIQTCRLQQ